MCLLSVYSPDARVNIDHLLAGADCNPDGYGFAIIVGNRIETGKGMDPVATIDAFDRVREQHPESWALFHSRMTTDGDTTVDNCHPFLVGGDQRTVLGHNGILPREARPAKKDPRSDTRILAEDLIPGGMFGRLYRARARRRLHRWILSEGYGNKVAILTVDPRYKGNAFILGEDLGTWVDGVWHSNDGYIPWVPRANRGCAVTNEAFDKYMKGEMTYADYLDTRLGIPVDDKYLCYLCETSTNVDRVFNYCRSCKLCLDCFEYLDKCDCYSPLSQRPEVTAIQDAGLDDAAITAALQNLPDSQAAEIRAVLDGTPQN